MTMIAIWTGVILFSIFIEANTAALVSIWFIPPAVVALVLAIIGVPLTAQLLTFVLLSALLLILSRTVFKKFMKKEDFVPTNSDRLPGMEAVVTSEIKGGTELGEAKVDGKFWSAKLNDESFAAVGEVLIVDHIESTKLILRKKDGT